MIEIGPNLTAAIAVTSICTWAAVRSWAHRPAKPTTPAPAPRPSETAARLQSDLGELQKMLNEMPAIITAPISARKSATGDDDGWPEPAKPGGSLPQVAK